MTLTASSPVSEIAALNDRAWASQYTDPATTLELSARCIELAKQNNDVRGLAYALLNKAFYEIRYCPPAQAEATLREAETHFRQLDDKRGKLLVRSGFAGILINLREFDAARDLLEKVLDAPESEREPLDAYFALYRLGYLHFFRGEVQEGLRYYYKALALVQRERSTPLSCRALSDLGSAQMELGNYAEARDLLEQGYALCKEQPVCFSHLVAGNLASVYLEMGETAAALKIIENEFPKASKYFQPGEEAFLHVVAAQAYANLLRWDEAEQLAMQGLRHAQQHEHMEIINQCLWMLGVIACGKEQPEQGIQWLLQAERGFGEFKSVFYVLHVYNALAGAYAKLGKFDLAYGYLRRYQEHYETSLGSSSRARFFTLQIQHELAQAEFERDYALQQQIKLEALNGELRRKVDEVEQLQIALREQAVQDPLTGLYNRRFLSEQIEAMLSQAERAGYALSMVLLDLDNFKNINDTLGHSFGDQVLINLAALLRRQIRNSDLAVRYGGEEFCLVFPVSTAYDTKVRMDCLLKQFHDMSIVFGDKALTGLTFSAGIAQLFIHGTSAEELLLMADSALYRAKNEGRNRVLISEQPFS
ncbi:MAG TPA: tetratricopeptide repeat-containing diguanylate cyclase [Paucimonas sp.]|nr:tetratricopeptide repeat-containing diguanylate cyclase [Paucimonas sp.]